MEGWLFFSYLFFSLLAAFSFQLNLEIALNGVSAKIQPLRLIQPCRRCVETSGDVIENDFISTPDSRQLDLSPMRLGAAKTAMESVKSPLPLIHQCPVNVLRLASPSSITADILRSANRQTL